MAKLRRVKYVIFMRKNFSILGENSIFAYINKDNKSRHERK